MYKIKKIFKVPIGHRLSKHQGLCKNIHGHNLKIEIQLSSSSLNQNDMVLDFKDLKVIVNDILDKFDHCTIFNITDKDNINIFKESGYRHTTISFLDQDPTAEVFCKYLFTALGQRLATQDLDFQTFNDESQAINVDFVRVWENDDSMAEYGE